MLLNPHDRFFRESINKKNANKPNTSIKPVYILTVPANRSRFGVQRPTCAKMLVPFTSCTHPFSALHSSSSSFLHFAFLLLTENDGMKRILCATRINFALESKKWMWQLQITYSK